MKLVFILATFITVSTAQRGSYAGGNYIGLPELADRFKEDGDTPSSPSLVNRFDGTTAKIPVDARGDGNLVNRLNTWPNETKPFWLINAAHIEKQRNSTRPGAGRPSTGASSPNQSNTNLENRLGSSDNDGEIDDFGNPKPSGKPSTQPTGNRFSGSSAQPTRNRFSGSLP